MSEAIVNDDSINTTISEEGEISSETLSNEETIESSVKYVGIDLELFKDKNLQIEIAEDAGIMLVTLFALTLLITLSVQSLIANVLSDFSLDIPADLSFIKMFRFIGVFLSSGGISLITKGEFFGAAGSSKDYFTAVYVIAVIIITLVLTSFQRKLSKKKISLTVLLLHY